MRSVRVNFFGSAYGLENGNQRQIEIVDAATPKPGPDELLIHIKAAALNYADIMQAGGTYYKGPKPPFMAGIEAAGEVVETGSGAEKFAIGSRVCAVARGGLFSEYVTVNKNLACALPEHMDYNLGAAFMVSTLSAWGAIVKMAKAKRGEVILIQSGAGGFGSAAIQISKMLGLRIFATASTEEKKRKMISLGADAVSGYDDFENEFKSFNGTQGPDIALESVGGEIFKRTYKLLPPFGRIVVVGYTSLEIPVIDPVKLLFETKTISGFHLNSFVQSVLSKKRENDELDDFFSDVFMRIKEKSFSVNIDKTFPLEKVHDAYRYLGERKSAGKVVLLID